MRNVFIGIDPGLYGAVGVLNVDTGHSYVDDTPLIETGVYDMPGMVKLLSFCHPRKTFAIVERQQAMPRQGLSSTFKTGTGYGIWLGILVTHGIPFEIAQPKAWKKRMIPNRSAEKIQSVICAKNMFPSLAEKFLKSKDGRAEAMLMAEYARLRGSGKQTGD